MWNWIVSWIPRVVVATVVVTVLEVIFWPTLDLSFPKTALTQGTHRATAVADGIQTQASQTQSLVAQAFRGSHSCSGERSQLPTVEARSANSERIGFLTSAGKRMFGGSGSVQNVDGHQIVIQPGRSTQAGQ